MIYILICRSILIDIEITLYFYILNVYEGLGIVDRCKELHFIMVHGDGGVRLNILNSIKTLSTSPSDVMTRSVNKIRKGIYVSNDVIQSTSHPTRRNEDH